MCDLIFNFWLNFIDGSILCGRCFFDGSGGNNYVVDYYKKIGYFLVVKFGIIILEGVGEWFGSVIIFKIICFF